MKKKKSPRRLVGDSIRSRMKKPGKKRGLEKRTTRSTRPRGAQDRNGSQNNGKEAQSKWARAEHAEAVQRYIELFDFSPTGYVSLERSGRIAEINLTACKFFGFSRERMVGMPFSLFVWREDAIIFLHHLLGCRVSQSQVVTELRLKDYRKQPVPVQICSSPASTAMSNGALVFQTSIVDLTSRKQAETLLLEKEQELELIITQTPFMLTRCTRDLRYRYVSKAYAAMLNRKPDQIAGKPLAEIMGKEGLAAIRPYIDRVLSGETVTYESLVPLKGGLPRVLQGTHVPDKNQNGEVIGWIASMQDVSERKKDEERFRMAVEASPSGMVLIDQARTITLVNSQAEHLFGYTRGDLIGKSVEMLIPARLRKRFKTAVEAGTSGEARDLLALHKNGTEVPVEVGLNPIRLEGQRFILISVVDITERKKAGEKIDANLKAVTLLHELGEFCSRPGAGVRDCLRKILETAMTIGNADKGILQIINKQSGTLDVAVQSKLGKPFLKLFSNVKINAPLACALAIKEGNYTIVEDVTKSETFAGQRSLRVLLAAGIRAVHSMSLKSTAGNLVGVLSIYFSKPHRPRPREVGFIDLLARQAGDYIERKSAENALIEATRQQNALYQLARRWQNPRSLENIYSAALDAIKSALRCDRASILLYNECKVMRFVAWSGLSATYRKAVEGHSPWKRGVRNPQPKHIDDIRFASMPDALKATMRREGIRAVAFIPLVSDGKLIGKFMMYYRAPHVFNGLELDLAMTISRQLAQAIEHEKDEEALRERERELARELEDQKQLQKISSQLITHQKLETIYMQIIEATMAMVSADCGSMQMVLPKTKELLLLAQKGFHPDSAKAWERVPRNSTTSCAAAFRCKHRVIVPDLEKSSLVGKNELVLYRKAGIRSVQSTPLFSRTGELVGMMSNHWRNVHEPSKRELRLLDVMARQAADLIEWKHADDEVRASEARMRATVEQATAGVARCDIQGRIIFANEKLCDMLGYTESELIGKTFAEVTHADDLDANRRLFQQLIRDSKPFELEKRFIRKGGGILWADVSAGAVRGPDGKTQSTVAVVVDITARKEAETALQKSNELLEQRVRERTHELHLTNKRLHSEIERRKGLEGEILSVSDREQQRLGQELHDGLCQHLTAVAFMTRSIALRLKDHRVVDAADIEKVAELVNKAAIDTRNLSRALHRVDVDAAGLIVALQDLADREIWRTPCRLEAKPSFRIDQDAAAAHLYRIAREAVINANKHAHAREIVVSLERVRKEMVLRVTDDGVGLPKEVNPQQGLGFHIMNYRAQLMGGRLEIESPQTGGTIVSCYLPVNAAESRGRSNGAKPTVTGDLTLRHLARQGAANA